MKKFLSIVISIMMAVMAILPATAVAAEGEGMITVNGAVVGQTYTIYKLMNVQTDKSGTSATAYIYTPASNEWLAFLTSEDAAEYVTVAGHDADEDNGIAATPLGQRYVTWKKGDDDAAKAAFAKLANAYAKANNLPGTPHKAEAETFNFTGLSYGYYLMDSSLGALCNLTTVNPAVTISPKNTTPGVDKEVQEDSTDEWGKSNDAELGETVNFKAVITAYDGAEGYVLYDKLSNGLTYGEVTSVTYTHPGEVEDPESPATIPGTVIDTVDPQYYEVIEYKNATDDQKDEDPYTDEAKTKKISYTFKVKFDQEFLEMINGTEDAPEYITVYYNATVNENANIGLTGNDNTATLKYGVDTLTTGSSTKTHVWSFKVLKYTNKTTGETTTEVGLPNAKFVLYRGEGENIEYAKFDKPENDYVFTEWTTDEDEATKIISAANGNINVVGLDSGFYMLRETDAPAGYNKLDDDIKVEIRSTDDGNSMDWAVYEYTTGAAQLANNKTVKVLNQTGTQLPSTGGMGTTILYIAGGILVVGAVIFLVTRRRMSSEEA